MQYQTRHLIARVPMRYAGAQLQPGDEFAASQADARYLTRHGKADELQPTPAQAALPMPPLPELELAPAPAPRRTRRKPAAKTVADEPAAAPAADDGPPGYRHDPRFDPLPPATGISLQAAADHDDGHYSSDLLTRTRGGS
jgi:hypothetical protein